MSPYPSFRQADRRAFPAWWEDVGLAIAAAGLAMALTLWLNPYPFAPSGFGTDGVSYLGHARQLLRDGAFDMGPFSNYSFVAHRYFPAGTPNFYTPPVYIAVLAAGLAVWNSWQIALVENAIIFAATDFLGLRLLSLAGNTRWLQWLFAGLMALDPAYLLYNGGVQLDTLAAALSVACTWFWMNALRSSLASCWKFAVAGICGVAAVLTRGNTLPYLGLFAFLSALWRWRALSRRQAVGILVAAAIGAGGLGAWDWRTERITGVWSATGSGNAGVMLSLNYALGGTRWAPVKIWPQGAADAYIASLERKGVAPMRIEVEVQSEMARQVLAYLWRHPAWAVSCFLHSAVRLFLASEWDQPQLLVHVLGGTAQSSGLRAAADCYTFGSRGILLLAFLAFPLAMIRWRLPPEFWSMWIGTAAFVSFTAFIVPGADRYRIPVEPYCVLFVALGVACVCQLWRKTKGPTGHA